MKHIIPIILLISLLSCDTTKKSSGAKLFFESYQQLQLRGMDASLEKVLERMSRSDSTQVRKILIEYNESENERWLARFRTSTGRVVTLFKDGSID